jgi:hypothetical protein
MESWKWQAINRELAYGTIPVYADIFNPKEIRRRNFTRRELGKIKKTRYTGYGRRG